MYSNNSDIKIEINMEIALNGNFFACSIQRNERGNKISSFTTIVEQRAILFNTNQLHNGYTLYTRDLNEYKQFIN